MTDQRAIVSDAAEYTPDSHSRKVASDSPWRDDAFAVVIGINQYSDPKIPNLRFARADAEAVYQVLVDPEIGRFKPDNVTKLVDDQATERNIRSALATQLPKKAGKDATVVIYYAGHGAPVIEPRSKSTDGMEKYLVPHDAVADDLRSSGISMDAVQQYFSWLDASQVICFLDSCYSGTAGGRSFDNPDIQTRAVLSDEFLDSLASEGRFVVTACAANEVSLESAARGHGLFTEYLVEGLKGAADADGNGRVTIDELYEYVYKNVERDARSLGGSMNPVKKGSVRGTIYLTEYETETQKRIREGLKSAGEAMKRGDSSAALASYRAVLSLDAGNAEAVAGVAALEAENARKNAERQRRERALLGYVKSGELPMQEYNRALAILEPDPNTLSDADAQYRRFVDSLLDGTLSIRSFVRSIEMLDANTSELSQPAQRDSAPAPERPATVSPPPPERRTAAASNAAPPSTPAAKPAPAAVRDAQAAPPRRFARVAIFGAATAAIVVIALLLKPKPTGTIDSSPSANPPSVDQPGAKQSSASQPAAPTDTTKAMARPDSLAARKINAEVQQPPRNFAPPPVPTSADPASTLPALAPPTMTPASGSTGLSVETRFVLEFSDLGAGEQLNGAAATGNLIQLTGGGKTIKTRLSFEGNRVHVDPISPLDEYTHYTLVVAAGLKTMSGRALRAAVRAGYTTAVVDSLYFYRITNASDASSMALTADATPGKSSCRMTSTQSGGNQAWYFIPLPGGNYYYMHNASGQAANGLEAASPPIPCFLTRLPDAPPTGMKWKFIPASTPGLYFLETQNLENQAALALRVLNGEIVPMLEVLDPQSKAWQWRLERLQRR